MKKRSIRDLSRAPPEELWPLFELITNPEQPDSSVVMLGCATLEHALGEAIVRELTGTVDRKALFGDRGPLGDFFGKIVMAEALGVILPATARDLHKVRQIRNAFAHAAMPLSFETDEVKAEIDAITFFGSRQMVSPGPEGETVSPKEFFGLFVLLTCASFIMTPAAWAETRAAFAEWVSGFLKVLEGFRR